MSFAYLPSELRKKLRLNEYSTYEPDIRRIMKDTIDKNKLKRYCLNREYIFNKCNELTTELPGLLNKCVLRIEIFDLNTGNPLKPLLFSVDISDSNWCERLCKALYTKDILTMTGESISGFGRSELSEYDFFKCFSYLPENWIIPFEYKIGKLGISRNFNKKLNNNIKNKIVDLLCSLDKEKIRKFLHGNGNSF